MKKIYFLLYFLFISTLSSAQWTEAAFPGSIFEIYDIYYGNNQFVAVGANSGLKTGPDGNTWTIHPIEGNDLNSTCYGNGKYVSVGSYGYILTSPDGVTWTAQTSNTSNNLKAIIYNGTLFVAVGAAGKILTSSDGITWASQASGTANALEGVSYGNGKFVAVGAKGTILTSTDGSTWLSQTISGLTTVLSSVTYGKGLFVAVGESGKILTSSDASSGSWTSRTSGATDTFLKVTYGGGLFAAVALNDNTGIVRTSTDGTTWIAKDVSAVYNLYGVAYGNGKFVVGGERGDIYYSTAAALPVSLVSFKGESKGNTARLSWETTAEVNANYFEIQRSRDAQSFEAIGKVQAIGNSTTRQVYGFTDETPFIGTNYYRLKEVDKDGTSQEFRPVSVVIQGDDVAFGVYPNPVQSQEFTVKLEDADQAQLELRSVQGNRINFSTKKVGDYQVVIQPTQTLAKGMYLLSVKTIGSSRVHKVVFQ